MCIEETFDSSHISVPKGRRLVATGEAKRNPWLVIDKNMRPEGAAEPANQLIKDILLFKLNFVHLEKLKQFLSKRLYSMMFLLPLNIILNFVHLRLAHRKNAISLLPREHLQRRKCFMNPSRRVGFQISRQCCNRLISAPAKQNVNVVCNTSNRNNFTSFALNDSTEIVMDSFTDAISQPWLTMLRREHEIKFKIVKRAGHILRIIRRPFRAEDVYSKLPHGFRFASPVVTSLCSFGAQKTELQSLFIQRCHYNA
jgi:hypothetical protein